MIVYLYYIMYLIKAVNVLVTSGKRYSKNTEVRVTLHSSVPVDLVQSLWTWNKIRMQRKVEREYGWGDMTKKESSLC